MIKSKAYLKMKLTESLYKKGFFDQACDFTLVTGFVTKESAQNAVPINAAAKRNIKKLQDTDSVVVFGVIYDGYESPIFMCDLSTMEEIESNPSRKLTKIKNELLKWLTKPSVYDLDAFLAKLDEEMQEVEWIILDDLSLEEASVLEEGLGGNPHYELSYVPNEDLDDILIIARKTVDNLARYQDRQSNPTIQRYYDTQSAEDLTLAEFLYVTETLA